MRTPKKQCVMISYIYVAYLCAGCLHHFTKLWHQKKDLYRSSSWHMQ